MLSRRSLSAAVLACATLPFAAGGGRAAEQSVATAALFAFDGLEGGRIELGAFAGKPILVVNTASRCGFADQLRDMTDLWTRYRERGLAIIAVPSNDFRQEPGEAADIRAVCSGTYGATFPIAAKQVVTGPAAHPFYRWAARVRPGDTPRWNFHKYLVGADGQLAGSFPTQVRPTDGRIVVAIERELMLPAGR